MENEMKLSSDTLNVLKNFSTINGNILVKKGSKLSTISASKSVLAQANIKDNFPKDFCVYDLNQFLSVQGLFKDGEIDFTDSNILFKSGNRKTSYRMAAKETLVVPPEKELVMPTVDDSFTLKSEDYDILMKTASTLSSPHIGIISDGSTIEVVSFDAKDDSAHTNSIIVGEGKGKQYKIVFNIENLKMIPGSYDVSISFKGMVNFKNNKDDIQYWIAFESKLTKIGE